jgi:hypothetical protein
MGSPVLGFHSWIVPSSLPVASILPSGLNATVRMLGAAPPLPLSPPESPPFTP